MKIYVASSWRNDEQPAVVRTLRGQGHEVYDFRNPAPGQNGFAWSEIDPNWERWSTSLYREALDHPLAVDGFMWDMRALQGCDTCLLLQPCGRSAHLELGWAVGAGKKTLVLLALGEPELMYKMVDHICLSLKEVLNVLEPT